MKNNKIKDQIGYLELTKIYLTGKLIHNENVHRISIETCKK